MGDLARYGSFIDTEGCFELVNEPPRKWLNVHYNSIGGDEMYAEVSNLGDGPVWVRDAEGVTVNLVGYDCRFVYIRDDDSGTVFCPWGAPAPQAVTRRRCRYWAAKTETTGTCRGLAATLRSFVPREHPVFVQTVTVENRTGKPRNLSIFCYAMFQLAGCDAEGRGVWKDNYALVHPEIGGVFVTNRNRELPTDRFNGYLVCLDGFHGGSGYRDHFTRSDYGLGTPRILWGWDADNQPGFGPDCAGLVQVKLTIGPKGTGRADFLLGQARDTAEVGRLRASLNPPAIDRMCHEQMAIERDRAARFTVKTGLGHVDSMINHFVKKAMYSYLINKSGFRDNLQMDNALCLADYQAAEANLLRALASQYPTGQMPHGFRPRNRLQYSDKPAWTMLAIPGLVHESGDLSLLEKNVPYFESSETGTVWDHMLRAMRHLCADLGANGLCNQHHADWNDGLEATKESGERESVMVTQQLCYGLLEVEFLAQRLGKTDVAAEARQQYEAFKRRVNDLCWDGEWYVRTLCGDGYRIGSKDNKEGKIFINSQTWAVLSRIAPPDRARLCMESLDRLLECDLGWRLAAPAFSEYDPRVGRMSNTMPGSSENGGCYCHAAGFKGVADCMLGRAEEAWRTFVKTAPDSPCNPVSRSKMDPYSFTNSFSNVEMVYGVSGYPWRTGTAGWFTVLLVEWILGARRHLDGLTIAPCLSRDLKKASVTRTFRGAKYEISLDNSAGRCRGAERISVDGQSINGNILPVFKDGVHKVNVVI